MKDFLTFWIAIGAMGFVFAGLLLLIAYAHDDVETMRDAARAQLGFVLAPLTVLVLLYLLARYVTRAYASLYRHARPKVAPRIDADLVAAQRKVDTIAPGDA